MSWAGLCPRLFESAGTRRSTRIRQGAPWLKTTLVQLFGAIMMVCLTLFISPYDLERLFARLW